MYFDCDWELLADIEPCVGHALGLVLCVCVLRERERECVCVCMCVVMSVYKILCERESACGCLRV